MCSYFHIIKIAGCLREAQMKKEANIQRMAEKQKEAKLAVCAILYLRISFMHSFVLLFIACCHICVMKAKQVVILHVASLRQDWL